MKKLLSILIILLVSGLISTAYPNTLDREDVRLFIDEMSKKHGFKVKELDSIFRKVEFSEPVLKAISRPAETLPWHKYRPIFLGSARIQLGVEFWRQHRDSLQRAQVQFGVPAELVVAIIGVETRYGKDKGKYAVINSLSTLAFDYPKRSSFFRSELEQYLLLTKEQGFDPLVLTGSYAGAMGIPQFVSSSYRNYAIDFDQNGVIDIWNSMDDAIGSIGNYFKQHGWQTGGQVAMPAVVKGDKYKQLAMDDLKPINTADELRRYDVTASTALSHDTRARLLVLENENSNEYWLGFENFYVITRYNNSPLYAMAVYQLADEIRSMYMKEKN